MSKFQPADDGKVIDGKTVVYIQGPGAAKEGGPGGKATKSGEAAALGGGAAAKKELAQAVADTMAAAAKDGVPFCEECEKAKAELQRQMGGEPRQDEAHPEAEAAAKAESEPGSESESGDAAPAGETAGASVRLAGTLKGPAGPLKGFPFRLLRNGAPVPPDKSVATKNPSRGDVWLSDGEGKYLFEQLPEGDYQVAVYSPSGEVDAEEKGVEESGERVALPADPDDDQPDWNLPLDGEADA
jgi:hypothetical protein